MHLFFSFLVVERDGVLINAQRAVGLLCKLLLCPTLYDHQREPLRIVLFRKNDTASYIRE